MKRIFLLNKKKLTVKSIGVTGVSKKSGVTHLCFSLAGFISSVLRDKVVYVEYSKKKKILELVGEREIQIGDIRGYKYKGVNYVLTNDVNEVKKLLSMKEIWLIIDFDEINEVSVEAYNLCKKRMLIGSTMPWCIKEYYGYIYNKKNIINDISHVVCYTTGIEEKTKNNEKNNLLIPGIKNGIKINFVPIIANPFSLEEEIFDKLIKILE